MDQPNCNLDKRDFLGITPLIWAAICGQEGVAKLLLQQQTVNPDKPDKHFRRTALSWAAWKGHEVIVRLLLAKPDGTDGLWSKMPQVMNMIRGRRQINPNKPDKYGQTPIFLAATEGHEEVVQLLLRRKDVKADAADGYGCTPLFSAFNRGHEGVVKLLLEREDVSINEAEKNGQTLLMPDATHVGCRKWICRSGGTAVGTERYLNLNTHGNASQTLHLRASVRGHDGVVKLLLGLEDINPDRPDRNGRTPLSWAAGMGRDGVVKLLLGREDVNPDKPDSVGRTPLSWAVGNEHARVAKLVKLLLGREGVNPDGPYSGGRTLLSWAAENGHDGVVKLLLGREDINPNMPDVTNQTPLAWAAGNKRDGAVKLLLGREDVNPNMFDVTNRTPLLYATENGHDGIVKLLLGREGINPNKPDSDGRTPLLWAAMGLLRVRQRRVTIKYLLRIPLIFVKTPSVTVFCLFSALGFSSFTNGVVSVSERFAKQKLSARR